MTESNQFEKITAECIASLAEKVLAKVLSTLKGFAHDELQKIKIDLNFAFTKYIKKCCNNYGKAKTLLYKDEPQYLYDFFVCPNCEC